MFCKQCGAELADDEKLCSNCGTEVDGIVGSAVQQEKTSRNSRTKIAVIVIIGVIMLVAIIGLVIALVLSVNKDTTPSSGNNSPTQLNTGVSDNSANKDVVEVSAYSGKYKSDSCEIELTVFDISKDGEVFFEIGGLSDMYFLSGVADSEGNNAVFSIDDDGEKIAGTITFDAEDTDAVDLSFSAMPVNFEENLGSYTLKRYADVDMKNPYSDEKIGFEDFGIFTDFVESRYADNTYQWIYLGSTLGMFGCLSYENIEENADLYRLTVEGKTTYYAVCPSGIMMVYEISVYKIVDGKMSDILFTKTPEENGIPTISEISINLEKNIDDLNIGTDCDLYGPYDNDTSIDRFFLSDIDGVDHYRLNVHYWELSSYEDPYIGVKKTKIVYWGYNNISRLVKNIIPESASFIEPAIYNVREKSPSQKRLDSYVWKLGNGYLAVFVTPDPSIVDFYDQSATAYVYVSDLSYLSFIDS